MRSPRATASGLSAATFTANSRAAPEKFCRSSDNAALSPGASTRGVEISATSGARTMVSASAPPYRFPPNTTAVTRTLPLKSGIFSATVAAPFASSATAPENRSTVCTLAVGRRACGRAASAMSPP